jgi:hypothetical protein
MTAVCPVCQCEQAEGVLCHNDTTALERELGDVAAIVGELDVTISKQAKIGNASGPGSLARERTPVNWGAAAVLDDLTNTLTTWARDLVSHHWFPKPTNPLSAHVAANLAARVLLTHVPEIRRHPAVTELVDEIIDAIAQARRAVDRPADKVYLGQCLVETPDEDGRQVTCLAEIYARPAASEVQCRVCSAEHPVAERREWLLQRARGLLFTVQEAAQLIGSYGELRITESTIRNYVSSGQIGYHGKVGGSSVIRMGDLLDTIATHAAKPRGRKLKRAS